MSDRRRCEDVAAPECWVPDRKAPSMNEDMAARAAKIDATYRGTPSGSHSDWKLGRSPGSFRSNR